MKSDNENLTLSFITGFIEEIYALCFFQADSALGCKSHH